MSALGVSWAELANLAREHLLLSGCAVLLAIAIGLPLAILAAHRRGARGPLLAVVSLLQTIPGLALLALFYPLLLFLADLSGLAIPALGFLPALLALTVYALLPIVRNGVAAIRGIDPALIEAAEGLGMTAGQRLRLVELPLGAPVILAGIRTAAVWTIGTATLATTIGQPTLGDLIFSGLQIEDWRRVLAGCIAAALLALLVDAMLAQVEAGLATRSRARLWAGLGLLLLALAAAFMPLPSSGGGAGRASDEPAGKPVVIGAKNFSEQYILARVIEARLRAAGYRTERRDNLGSSVAYRALAAGDIAVYVDYAGTLWANVLQREDRPDGAAMMRTLSRELADRDGVTLLGPLGFENAYAFAMRRDRAEALGIATLADLARESPRLRLGSDLEFLSRPEWRAVEVGYGPAFRSQRAYSPTFMYRALADGSVDVISAFSSDGRIAALDLVTLDDPAGALPRYDALLLLSGAAARDPRLVAALQPLVGSIPMDAMRAANWMVDRDADKRTPADAARWLLAREGPVPAR
ncbi:ABC transporter substrate binding/permease protein [Sphingobium sp. SYK-6]|uniref:ABC transporter permease/substrate-binding protein n=1 Tax=Sphingobium sp. (strain NBRC 103272 / SYK-6) TaxID=627192 RepID=UPI0002276D71|nr:ABC transporter permease/substrate-binding protein [Sphingobium sp. SYK-6]BAK65597.1 ABC transporter substrate binding/permease protein [Sphingobium sp. SYK-6]